MNINSEKTLLCKIYSEDSKLLENSLSILSLKSIESYLCKPSNSILKESLLYLSFIRLKSSVIFLKTFLGFPSLPLFVKLLLCELLLLLFFKLELLLLLLKELFTAMYGS